MQRLHFLTAFVATGFAVWVIVALASRPELRPHARIARRLLEVLLALQLILGVEAWMKKFGTFVPWDLVRITNEYVAIRTAHALVGSCLLATALVMALRLRVPVGDRFSRPDQAGEAWSAAIEYDSRGVVVATRFRGDAP
jgi:hypothetical protein